VDNSAGIADSHNWGSSVPSTEDGGIRTQAIDVVGSWSKSYWIGRGPEEEAMSLCAEDGAWVASSCVGELRKGVAGMRMTAVTLDKPNELPRTRAVVRSQVVFGAVVELPRPSCR
jgi:hypothetical protein